MLVEKDGVLNCIIQHCVTNLLLFSVIILAVLRNVFKDVFFWGYGSGGGVDDGGGAVRKALLGVCERRG